MLSLGRHPRDRCGVAALAHADSPAGAAIAVYKPCPVYVRKVWRRRWANVRCTRRISKKPCKSLADSDASEHDCKCWCPRFESGSRHPRKACKRRRACTPHRWTSDQPRRSHGPFRAFFSALGRAHAAATHVGPGVRERRAIVGSFRGLGPPRWRADPPPPARPPGRATIGWRIGPPAGGARATRRRRGPSSSSSPMPPSVSGSGWRPARCCSRTWPRPRRARGVPRRRGQETLPHPPGR